MPRLALSSLVLLLGCAPTPEEAPAARGPLGDRLTPGTGGTTEPVLPTLAHADAELVIGSRYVPGGGIANWPLHRRFLSGFANLYTRLLLRLPVKDCTAGFRCYTSEVLETIDTAGIKSSGYSFLEEMVFRVHRAGFRIGETPILFEDRVAGASKINRAEIFRAAAHVLGTALRPPKRAVRKGRVGGA